MVAGFTAVIAFKLTDGAASPRGREIRFPGIQQWNFAELPKVQDREGAANGAPPQLPALPRPARAVRSCWCTARRAPTPACSSLPRRCKRPAPASMRSAWRGHGGSGHQQRPTSPISDSSTTTWPTSSKASASTSRAWHRTLAGFFFLAGGLVLRIAGGPQGQPVSTTTSRSRPTSRKDSPTNKPNSGGWAGVALPPQSWRCRCSTGSACRGSRGLPAVPLRHGSQGRQQPDAGLLLPAGGQPAARPRNWRARLAPQSSHTNPHRGRRRRRAVQCRPVPAQWCRRSVPRIGVTVVPNEGHLAMIAGSRGDDRQLPPRGRKLAGGLTSGTCAVWGDEPE